MIVICNAQHSHMHKQSISSCTCTQSQSFLRHFFSQVRKSSFVRECHSRLQSPAHFRTTFPHCDLRHIVPPFAFPETAAILPELGTVTFRPSSAVVLLTTLSFSEVSVIFTRVSSQHTIDFSPGAVIGSCPLSTARCLFTRSTGTASQPPTFTTSLLHFSWQTPPQTQPHLTFPIFIYVSNRYVLYLIQMLISIIQCTVFAVLNDSKLE